MANLNSVFLFTLAILSVFSGLESRNPAPAYPAQGYFAILYAAAAVGLVLYKMRTP